MILRNILNRKRIKLFAVLILVLSGTCFFLYHSGFLTDKFIPFLSAIDNSYLLLIEKFAGQLLYLAGSDITIGNHVALLNSEQLSGFNPETLYKKWGLILLILIWITKTSTFRKTLFTLLLLVANFLVVSADVALKACLATLEYYNPSVPALSLTIGTLFMASILFLWYGNNKGAILKSLSNLKIGTKILENKLPSLISIVFIYIITATFLVEYFDYRLWIDFLFTSSQKILALVGYKATVEPFNLIGENGSIYMAKGCLGINTMLLFASFVFLTGTNNRQQWIFIIAGILFLNLVNIIRFVFLFIHIQKNGDYVSTMDLHDMYNYITYAIVFILWVVWFEKFGNLKSKHREKG